MINCPPSVSNFVEDDKTLALAKLLPLTVVEETDIVDASASDSEFVGKELSAVGSVVDVLVIMTEGVDIVETASAKVGCLVFIFIVDDKIVELLSV